MKSIKPTFHEGLKQLNKIYGQKILSKKIQDLYELYELCSQTEDWVTVLQIKWYYEVNNAEAIRLYHSIKGVIDV